MEEKIAATMAILLCVLPYSLLRGPVSRLAMRRHKKAQINSTPNNHKT